MFFREFTGLQGSLALAPSWLLRALAVVLLRLWKELGDRPSFGKSFGLTSGSSGLTSRSSLDENLLGSSPELDPALMGR